MTEKAAENFVENSHNNAKELERAGILESTDNGNYKFTDAKSKEILNENADKKVDDIAQKNLDSYNKVEVKESSTDKEFKDTSKEFSKVESTQNQSSKKVESNDKFDSLNNLQDTNKETSRDESSIKQKEIHGSFAAEKEEEKVISR